MTIILALYSFILLIIINEKDYLLAKKSLFNLFSPLFLKYGYFRIKIIRRTVGMFINMKLEVLFYAMYDDNGGRIPSS